MNKNGLQQRVHRMPQGWSIRKLSRFNVNQPAGWQVYRVDMEIALNRRGTQRTPIRETNTKSYFLSFTPARRFISFSLFRASTGVRLFMSRAIS